MTRGTHYAAEFSTHCDGCPRCVYVAPTKRECAEGRWMRARFYATFNTGDVPVGWYKANPRPKAA